MAAEAALKLGVLQEFVDTIHTVPTLYDLDTDRDTLRKIQDDLTEVMGIWRAKQAEKRLESVELQHEVALAEEKLAAAKKDGSNHEELERVREQLAQAQARERQMQADDLEECIEAIGEQMASIKLQKETLEKPDADEAFLKNELSLFMNVASILPDLGDPKFSGTFVDKQKGVRTFKFPSAEMSQYETCKAAWDMMR